MPGAIGTDPRARTRRCGQLRHRPRRPRLPRTALPSRPVVVSLRAAPLGRVGLAGQPEGLGDDAVEADVKRSPRPASFSVCSQLRLDE